MLGGYERAVRVFLSKGSFEEGEDVERTQVLFQGAERAAKWVVFFLRGDRRAVCFLYVHLLRFAARWVA